MSGLRHVVTLTFRDDTPTERIDEIVTAMRALPSQIPEVTSYVVGADVGKSEGNSTIGIVADFADWDGYVTYRDHPAHVAVGADMILPILTGRGAVQHELP